MESQEVISTLMTSLSWHPWQTMPMRPKLLQHLLQSEPLSPLLSLCPSGPWWIQMQKLKNCQSMAPFPPLQLLS